VALGYKQLHNKDIEKIPIPLLQTNGFLFIWVINARYAYALDLMEKWGYRFACMAHTQVAWLAHSLEASPRAGLWMTLRG
jgi:N6-adenosine-specific RNA methylase IME4